MKKYTNLEGREFSELEMSVRLNRLLCRWAVLNKTTLVSDLVETYLANPNSLLSLKGFGKKTWGELTEILCELGVFDISKAYIYKAIPCTEKLSPLRERKLWLKSELKKTQELLDEKSERAKKKIPSKEFGWAWRGASRNRDLGMSNAYTCFNAYRFFVLNVSKSIGDVLSFLEKPCSCVYNSGSQRECLTRENNKQIEVILQKANIFTERGLAWKKKKFGSGLIFAEGVGEVQKTHQQECT